MVQDARENADMRKARGQEGNLLLNIGSRDIVWVYILGGLWGYNKKDNRRSEDATHFYLFQIINV